MAPATVGASLSGEEKAEALLCRLSLEDLGLSVRVDIVVKIDFGVIDRISEA
jgi:hypothetical protein